MYKPTICLDFDGVIHSYEHGWMEGRIYGRMLPGFIPWAMEAMKDYQLVVYSSRSKTADGLQAMREWMMGQVRNVLETEAASNFMMQFRFDRTKPAAFLTIDDRAIKFMGDWNDPGLSMSAIGAFTPWNQKPVKA